jgi:hypothetical protein
VQAWLVGSNPELDDAVPITLLREGNPERIATIVYQLDYDGTHFQSRHGTIFVIGLFEPSN